MLLALDTSAINNLLDDPACQELTACIVARYEVLISSLNLLEIAKTRDPVRRESLRRVTHQLGRDIRPLDLPNHLVRQVCRIIVQGSRQIQWSTSEERLGFWVAMSAPDSLGEHERQEAVAWIAQYESGVDTFNRGLREELNELVFGKGERPRPRRPAELVRLYMNADPSLIAEVPVLVFGREIGRTPSASEVQAMLHSSPPIWPLFLLAYAFSMYYGAVWDYTIGPRNRASIIDLLYALYLPVCDVFVTHDTRHGGQYDALRLLNAFSNRRPRAHVLNWRQFRATLGALTTQSI